MKIFLVNVGKLPRDVNIEEVVKCVKEQYDDKMDKLSLGYHPLQLKDRKILIELTENNE